MDPKDPVVVRGDVRKAPVRQGTASAHTALVLTTDAGDELILQRIGANPFVDPEGDRLVGQRVAVQGYRRGKVFRYVSASPEPSTSPPRKPKTGRS